MALGLGNSARDRFRSPAAAGTIQGRRVVGRRALTIALVATDAFAISAALALSYFVRFQSGWDVFYEPPDSPIRFYSTLVFWLVPIILIIFAAYQLYVPRQIFDGAHEYAKLTSAATLSLLLVVLLSFFFDHELVISRGWVVISWVLLILFVGGMRFVMRRIVYRLRRQGVIGRRVGLVAAGEDGRELFDRFREMPSSGLQVVTIIHPDSLNGSTGTTSDGTNLRALISAHRLDEIVVSSASVPQPALARIVRELAHLPTELHLVPGMYEIQTTGVQVREIRGMPLVTMNKVRITGIDSVLKRALDYAVAGSVLLLLSPLLLGIMLVIRQTSPGPIFHRRQVLGERGRRFDALKFRTMYINGDEILASQPELLSQLRQHGKLIEDPRVTTIGRWIRRWSIDELPQLVNVLRGQMSLVGPRMITEHELERFGHWQDNLTTVKPGITGLWQVSGRSNLGYDDRVRLDMYYIRSYSIWEDIEILIRTIPAVLRGTGAY